MLHHLGRAFNREDKSYTVCNFFSDLAERGYCCVQDANDRDDRCCALTTADPDTRDICCAGSMHDVASMDDIEAREYAIRRLIQGTLWASIVLFSVIGVFALSRPETIVFNKVSDDVVAERVLEAELLRSKASEKEASIHKKENADLSTLQGIVDKYFSGEDTVKERQELNDLHQSITDIENAAHDSATNSIAAIVAYGGYNIFYAVICVRESLYPIVVDESSVHFHFIWYVVNLMIYALATANRGKGMQSADLVILMLGVCALGAVLWVYIWRKIMLYTMQKPKKSDF